MRDCSGAVIFLLSGVPAKTDIFAMIGHITLEFTKPSDYNVAVESVVELGVFHMLSETRLDIAESKVVKTCVVKDEFCGQCLLVGIEVAFDVEPFLEFVNHQR